MGCTDDPFAKGKKMTMKKNFRLRDIISIGDFSKEEIHYLLRKAQEMKQAPISNLLTHKILASCFFEPSTRTRLSFESAMLRLGGSVIGFADAHGTSARKGERLSDAMRMVEHYADVAVLRHPTEGAAQLAADAARIPIINAGDGANQHPTQTFLDLFSILETQGTLENLHIALVGDLKYGRTVHSLAQGLIPFKARLYFISPPTLEMPKGVCDLLREKGVKFSFHPELKEVARKLDILYMTRLQEERFSHPDDYRMIKNTFILKPEHLEDVKANLRILHPLPRVQEIDTGVDRTPYAYYFQQAENGLHVRQALLALILGVTE